MATEQSRLLPEETGRDKQAKTTGTPRPRQTDSLTTLFHSPEEEGTTTFIPTFPSERGDSKEQQQTGRFEFWSALKRRIAPLEECSPSAIVSTLIGSFVFLSYHLVFCLAAAATIAPTVSSTGLLARVAALGTLTAAPIFIFELGSDIPAIYPASDLFLAPFLSELADKIQGVLVERGLEENDEYFLATFLMVSAFGLVLSGVCCILAARFKIANLGGFLPYSVLSGLLTTIGILIYTLSVSVDTGMKIGEVLTCNDASVFRTALLHHAPSLFVGIVMHLAGKKHPYMVILCLFMTVLGSYIVLWLTGTSIHEAQEAQWFFSAEDLAPPVRSDGPWYGPPLPFGLAFSLWRGTVVWEAAFAGVPSMLSLAFLYVIRCSVHSAALKGNIPKVTRKSVKAPSERLSPSAVSPEEREEKRRRRKRKKEVLALGNILERGYGYSQLVAAVVGGIGVAPSVAASLTMFHLGAESRAPQYGSCALLLIFYLSDFQLVQYIPKPAFSCLMVLAGIDMCRTWILGSFFKTKDKLEWAVAPLLVILAFSVGVLDAILLGVAISTFIFAANFYKAGTVRYVGSGLALRSTVERGVKESAWLDQNADLTQILILQNYVFFGNAQSILNYVQTMFDDEEEDDEVEQQDGMFPLPPIPKFLIVDFQMISGMDTSAADLFREVANICSEHHCKLLLSGVSQNLRSMLVFAGIRRTDNTTSYIGDLETALAKSEDALLSTVFRLEAQEMEESKRRERSRSLDNNARGEDGFLYALRKIDEQHGSNVAFELERFAPHTITIDLATEEVLVRDTRNPGIYFVESGLMRVKHATGLSTMSLSTTTATSAGTPVLGNDPTISIGHLNARTTTLGRQRAAWKKERGGGVFEKQQQSVEPTFRLARVGQGWVIGSIEAAATASREVQHTHAGVYVAVTDCRLHFLPFSAVREMETRDPTLSMNLYKLMSLLATKRQETTIQQLDQLVQILNAPTPRLRGGKRELAKLQNM